jgi:hypothetical protein
MQGKTTKENFLSMIEIASDGADKLIQMIHGHSITMNVVVKIISCNSTFKDYCTAFPISKMKKKKTKVVSIYDTLNQETVVTSHNLRNYSVQWTMI